MTSQFKQLTRVLAKSFGLDSDDLIANFRLACREDIPQVSDLRRKVLENGIKEDDRRYLQWRYFDRPGYSPTLWVIDYRHQIIATLGTEPVELQHNGNVEPALRNMDAAIEPKYQSRGLGAWMTLAIQEQNTCVLVTGGNDNSTSMLNKLFTALPVRKNFKIILRSRDYLDGRFSHLRFASFIAPFLDIAIKLYLNIKWASNALPEKYSLIYFNDINQLLKHIVDPAGRLAKVNVVRSKSYLKWRYADNPTTRYWAVGAFDEDKLLAFVIYNIENQRSSASLGIGQIVDWNIYQTSNAARILTYLFIAAIKKIKKAGAVDVSLVLNDNYSNRAASAAGFVFRNVESSFFVYHKNLPENSLIFSPDAWYQSLGDSDTV